MLSYLLSSFSQAGAKGCFETELSNQNAEEKKARKSLNACATLATNGWFSPIGCHTSAPVLLAHIPGLSVLSLTRGSWMCNTMLDINLAHEILSFQL